MGVQRVFETLQTRFSSMASQSKNSSTLDEQEQKTTATAETLDNDLPAVDKAKERQLVRKLDLYIVPVVMLLYLFSFLDR
jgi:hypothetical protein